LDQTIEDQGYIRMYPAFRGSDTRFKCASPVRNQSSTVT